MAELTAIELYEKQQKQVVAMRKKRAAGLKKLTSERAVIATATSPAGILAAVAHLSAADRGALHREIAVQMDAVIG